MQDYNEKVNVINTILDELGDHMDTINNMEMAAMLPEDILTGVTIFRKLMELDGELGGSVLTALYEESDPDSSIGKFAHCMVAYMIKSEMIEYKPETKQTMH